MSPRSFASPATETVLDGERRLWIALGIELRDTRLSKRWTVAYAALRAGVSSDVVYLIEAGRPASTEAAVRLAAALGRRLEFELVDPHRQVVPGTRWADPVHSAMGEFEARHFRQVGFLVGIDEPYQHYQFAGRADLVAWDVDARAILHMENRSRFPDIQETAGSFNAKKAYLADSIGKRLGIARWASQTHVIAGLWSAEVLHTIRLRTETFRSMCPDGPEVLAGWWLGKPPISGLTSALIVLDPAATPRQRTWIGLEEALGARPRHRGYADAAAQLGGGG